MKNKKNLKIILIIILVIIAIAILAIVLLSNINTYTATIIEVHDNSIIIEDDSRLIPLTLNNLRYPDISKVYGHLVYEGNNAYGTAKNLIYLNDVCLLDINWRKINKENLKTGDKIYIISTKAGHNHLSTVPPVLHNVKLIKVLNNADQE